MKRLRAFALAAAIVGFGLPSAVFAASYSLVYYLGTDQHVHELRYNGSSWATTDLETATGAPSAASESSLVGNPYGSSDNIYYVAVDGDIHDFTFYGSPASWHTLDITA